METLGKTVAKISATLASPQRSGRGGRLAPIDPSRLPPAYDRVVDLEMPRRLWCGWKVELSGRMIRRPLTDDEHAMLETRADELEIALTPYMRPHQDDIIAEAISDMLGGFQGARATGADALGKIASMMALLEPFPAWAIREACAAMRRNGYEVIDRDGNKRRERHWPPSDAEVYAEVEEVVRLRRAALESARALLSAQVDA